MKRDPNKPQIDTKKRATGELPEAYLKSGANRTMISDAARQVPRSLWNSTVIALTVTREADDAVITISDNGIGLEAEARERVFELFARVEESHSEREGLGIGLIVIGVIILLNV